MATYYVRKDGNDTTGNGSTGTPWLTIKKAVATVTNGDTIKVGNGTYAEDDFGSLALKRVFTAYVTIEPELGALGDVTITTTSGTIGTWVSASAAYYKFRYIKFTTIAGAANAFRINEAADHIDFEYCTFTPVNDAASTIFIYDSGAWNVSNITFTNCTINKPASSVNHACLSIGFASTGVSSNFQFINCTITGIKYAASLSGADGIIFNGCTITADTNNAISITDSPDGLQILNCTVNSALASLYANGATNLVITGGTFTNTGNAPIISLGLNSHTGGVATTATITGCTLVKTSGTGHGLLLGNGCVNCVITSVYCDLCYDYAVVIKECDTNTVTSCNLKAGEVTTFGAALYCKAATNATITYNTLRTSKHAAFQMLIGDTGNKNQNVTFTHNKLLGSGTGALYNVCNDDGDLGGGVFDYNTYKAKGTGKFGAVRNDADVQSLAELRAAWADYDVTTNDSHSKMWSDAGAMLLFMKKR